MDGYANLLNDIYLVSSTTDGVSWSAAARADGDVAGAASSTLGPKGLVTVPGERIFVAFSDGRDDRDRSANIYANGSPAAPLNFGPDRRIDADGAPVNAWQFDPDLATDAASHVYVAFAGRASGPYSDIHVAASGDGGHSFDDPVKASPWTAGSRICRVPRILARSSARRRRATKRS